MSRGWQITNEPRNMKHKATIVGLHKYMISKADHQDPGCCPKTPEL